MKNILVVEDNRMVGLMVSKRLEQQDYEPVWVKTMAEARHCLEEGGTSFFAALLDYNLPDASNGEIIDLVVGRDIPAIVFTGMVDNEVRDKVWTRNVVDYVLKEDSQSLNYIIYMLGRLDKNRGVKVLVVDSSPLQRQMQVDLLKIHRYQVLVADSGDEALEICQQHPEIKLIITDVQLPEMDGLELVKRLRRKYRREDMAIIGISSRREHLMAARFIKYGATDFLVKESLIAEEFYSRVTQAIEYLEQICLIRESAIKDHLTGLYNRRYFFDAGTSMVAGAQRNNTGLVCAMLDIDFFKKVNDSYGHDVGDLVLRQVAAILTKRIRKSDIVARVGGEEFCILAQNVKPEAVADVFDGLRRTVGEAVITVPITGEKLSVTISIGFTTRAMPTLGEMMKTADAFLYQAKDQGRNRVVGD